METKKLKLDLDKTKKIGLYWTGGFDSTVLLYQLLKQGYDVTCFYVDIQNNPHKTKREQEAREKIQKYFNELGFYFGQEEIAKILLPSTGCGRLFDQMPLFICSVLNIPDNIDTVVFAYVSNDDAVSYTQEIKTAVESLMFMRHKHISIEFPLMKYKKQLLIINNHVPRETLQHITFCEGDKENCGTCVACRRWQRDIEPYLPIELRRFDNFMLNDLENVCFDIIDRNESLKPQAIEVVSKLLDRLKSNKSEALPDKGFPKMVTTLTEPQEDASNIIDLDKLSECKHEYASSSLDGKIYLHLPIGDYFVNKDNKIWKITIKEDLRTDGDLHYHFFEDVLIPLRSRVRPTKDNVFVLYEATNLKLIYSDELELNRGANSNSDLFLKDGEYLIKHKDSSYTLVNITEDFEGSRIDRGDDSTLFIYRRPDFQMCVDIEK